MALLRAWMTFALLAGTQAAVAEYVLHAGAKRLHGPTRGGSLASVWDPFNNSSTLTSGSQTSTITLTSTSDTSTTTLTSSSVTSTTTMTRTSGTSTTHTSTITLTPASASSTSFTSTTTMTSTSDTSTMTSTITLTSTSVTSTTSLTSTSFTSTATMASTSDTSTMTSTITLTSTSVTSTTTLTSTSLTNTTTMTGPFETSTAGTSTSTNASESFVSSGTLTWTTEVSTTRTTTTTIQDSTTLSTASTLAPPQITGSIEITGIDPVAVRNGPDAGKLLTSVGLTIAQVTGTPARYVTTWFAKLRRLMAASRGLSTAVLVVEYSISVPADVPADIPDIAATQASLDSVDVNSFTSLLQANLDAQVGGEVYVVTVTGVTSIIIEDPGAALPEGGNADNSEEDAPEIIVGIVVSSAVVLVCGSLALCQVLRRHRRQRQPARQGNDLEIPRFDVQSALSRPSARSDKQLSVRFEDGRPPAGAPSLASVGSASAAEAPAVPTGSPGGPDPGTAEATAVGSATSAARRRSASERRRSADDADAASAAACVAPPLLPEELLVHASPAPPAVPVTLEAALLLPRGGQIVAL
ncbi:unnamed protein product [Prorocentrum cordatum]|uniref:Subtilisin n=2 Tax=Prorocentrum cordatum TaxID=2364126 RepID=A0ABN9PK20_9DINO|nr:unnamed protein product [Polarella glacialis]